jgi:phage tail-like protein
MPATVVDSRSNITTDPLRNFRFRVDIHHTTPSGRKLTQLGFMQCAGLNVETSVITYRQGGYNTTTQKMPGQSEFTPITLSRGAMVNTPHSYEWMNEIFSVIQGQGNYAPDGKSLGDFRTDMTIKVLAHPWTTAKVPVKLRFRVFRAWPVSMGFSDLDAGGNAVLMEQMVIQHEGWKAAYAPDAYGSDAPSIAA